MQSDRSGRPTARTPRRRRTAARFVGVTVAVTALVALATPVAAHGSDPRPLRLDRAAAALAVATAVAAPTAWLLADRDDGATAFARLAGALATLSLGLTYVVPAVRSPGPLLALAGAAALGAALLAAVAPRVAAAPERRAVEGVALAAAGQATLPLAIFAGTVVGLAVGTGPETAWWRRQPLAVALVAVAAVPAAVALARAPHTAVDAAFAATGGALAVFGADGLRRHV